jgi:hypothetical protein
MGGGGGGRAAKKTKRPHFLSISKPISSVYVHHDPWQPVSAPVIQNQLSFLKFIQMWKTVREIIILYFSR